MNKNYLICVAFLLSLATEAQVRVGVSISSVHDFDWNRPLKDLTFNGEVHRITSVIPISYGVQVENNFGRFTPSLGIGILDRRLDINTTANFVSNTSRINHRTLEVPLSFQYFLPLVQNVTFVPAIGVSMDYVLTSTRSMTHFEDNSLTWNGFTIDDVREFKVINPDKVIFVLNASIGVKNDFKDKGSLLLRFSFHYQLNESTRYEYTNHLTTMQSNIYRANYAKVELTYLFPSLKKEKID